MSIIGGHIGGLEMGATFQPLTLYLKQNNKKPAYQAKPSFEGVIFFFSIKKKFFTPPRFFFIIFILKIQIKVCKS